MIPLAVAALAASVGGAQLQGVQVVTTGSGPLIQVHISGPSPKVSVQREGDAVRVWLEGTSLGGPFSGGDRFEWVAETSAPSATPGSPSLGALGMQRYADRVCLYFRLPATVAIAVRRAPALVMLLLHESPTPAVVAAPPPAVPPPAAPAASAQAPSPTVLPPAAGTAAAEPGAEPAAASESATDLLRSLFPASASSGGEPPDTTPASPPVVASDAQTPETRFVSSDELYRKLFPGAPTEPEATPPVAPETTSGPSGPRTLTLGFLTLSPSVRAGYINGETTFESPQPTNASYLQIEPGLVLEAIVGDGRLTLAYAPDIRTFASDDLLEEPTHRLDARLEVPVGTRFRLSATDTFVNGVLETQEVDPGSEYFFGLSRFRRNLLAVNGSLEVAPRLTIEGGGALNTVRFEQPVGFFPYDSRSGFLGLGFELTRTLKATLGYANDRVPPPDDRPVAEATAHSVQARVSGEITPLIAGQVTLGYRDQTSPQAPESGRRFRGLVASGSLSRTLGPASWLNLAVSRATPVSNFESNAFYVSTFAGAGLVLPLPLAVGLDSGIDYRWNDYRTDASALGVPREDRILGWRAGLRRSLGGMTSLAVSYRRDRRRSNLDLFDTTTGGLIVQLDVNVASGAGRRW